MILVSNDLGYGLSWQPQAITWSNVVLRSLASLPVHCHGKIITYIGQNLYLKMIFLILFSHVPRVNGLTDDFMMSGVWEWCINKYIMEIQVHVIIVYYQLIGECVYRYLQWFIISQI